MKAMKGLSMKSMLGSVRSRSGDGASVNGAAGSQQDTPEANAARSVRLFCESGGPNNSGEEVLHLPTIVEAAESSPAAAKECAQVIRKFLTRDNFSRPYVQYNGIMLVRILSDNPGPTFTRNIDKKFVETVKELLRAGRDPSVKQILIETLENFQREKKQDEGLALLIHMWEKEQGKMAKSGGPAGVPLAPAIPNATSYDQHNQNYFSRNHSTNRGLPPPPELASRIEEARTTAKLLTQLVQSTPPAEFLQNELVFEFANRCTSASRSIQGYITAQDPAPDNDTMLTLIETNDQLALAMSKHQRAVLLARKSQGIGEENAASSRNSPDPTAGVAPPPGPPPSSTKPPVMPSRQTSGGPPPHPSKQRVESHLGEKNTNDRRSPAEKPDDPFKDPTPVPYSDGGLQVADQLQDFSGLEPYHPGFKPSQSYMGRQYSAIGKTIMHAAVPTTPDLEGTEKEVAAPVPVREEDEDSYNVSPVHTKAPIYRY